MANAHTNILRMSLFPHQIYMLHTEFNFFYLLSVFELKRNLLNYIDYCGHHSFYATMFILSHTCKPGEGFLSKHSIMLIPILGDLIIKQSSSRSKERYIPLKEILLKDSKSKLD